MPLDIKLLPVDYAQVNADWLEDKKPYKHQLEVFNLTEEAISSRKFLCIFNTSATGGGKTLASFAYPMKKDKPVIGIYPTNELIEDQARSLEKEYQRYSKIGVHKINSRELDKWEAELEKSRHSDALETVLSWKDAILTNPDIVYLTFFGYYNPTGKPGQNERLFQKIASYQVYVFDEFHLYNVKQVGNIATIIGALHALQKNQSKIFIFSSATPSPIFLSVLDKLGIETQIVAAEEANQDTQMIRRVAHPVHLTILPAALARWQAFDALQENFTVIQEFIESYPEAKSVFIIDGVADAVLLANYLRTKLGDENVGEIHGLSSVESRRDGLMRPHTVGTSTIEVGIDFKDETEKDLLVFEAKTAAQFIQRLGRVGRHQKSTGIPNRTIALVPPYVYNFLQENLGNFTEVNRAQLMDMINEGYRSVNQFKGYFKLYTPVEAFELNKFISHQMQPDVYGTVRQALEKMVNFMSERQIDKIAKSHAWLKGNKLLNPLHSFRGSGFNVAIIDKTEKTGNPVKTYNLSFILRRCKFKELSRSEFFQRIDQLQAKFPEINAIHRRMNLIEPEIDSLMGVYGYFEIYEILDQARKVWFEVPQRKVKKTEEITDIEGLTIKTEPYCELGWLNRLLKRKSFVCWIGRERPWTISFSKGLPPLFEVYELHVRQRLHTYNWSIVFNQNAYFLSCLRWEKEETKQ